MRKNKVRLFITNYPCLVNNMDTPKERKIYVDNSRLSNNFAEYQAFQKPELKIF